jgi:hypothetical protein
MTATTLSAWRDERRRKTLGAVVASIVVHLLLILLVAFALTFRTRELVPQAEEKPVELTLVAPPELPKQKSSYVETTESQRADKPPEDAQFESDKDTRAASPLERSGDAPLPSQEGRESPALDFENKEYTAGPQPRPRHRSHNRRSTARRSRRLGPAGAKVYAKTQPNSPAEPRAKGTPRTAKKISPKKRIASSSSTYGISATNSRHPYSG